jgi:hypothetical protein
VRSAVSPVLCIAGQTASSGIKIRFRRVCEVRLKTQEEIKAAVCEGIARFEQDYMARGPKDIRAYLLGDLLVVRLQGVLTAAEQHLVLTLPPRKDATCLSKSGRTLSKQRGRHWRR